MDASQSEHESFDHGRIDPNRPMDFQELCRYLRASPATLRTYLAEGLKEVGFKVGKEWRFLPLDVVEWLKWRERRRRATGSPKRPAAPQSLPSPAHPRIERFLNKHWPP